MLVEAWLDALFSMFGSLDWSDLLAISVPLVLVAYLWLLGLMSKRSQYASDGDKTNPFLLLGWYIDGIRIVLIILVIYVMAMMLEMR